MASPLVPSPLSFDVPVPEVIITRRTRTDSVTGKIDQVVLEGKVRLFCRSKGHGFIDPKEVVGEK